MNGQERALEGLGCAFPGYASRVTYEAWVVKLDYSHIVLDVPYPGGGDIAWARFVQLYARIRFGPSDAMSSSRYFADAMRETYRRSGLGKVVGLLADAGIEPESTVYDILKQVFVNATMMVFTETIGHVQVHALSSPM